MQGRTDPFLDVLIRYRQHMKYRAGLAVMGCAVYVVRGY